MNDPIDETFVRWRRSIDAELAGSAVLGEEFPEPLREAIHYSLIGEGKRLRGLLLIGSYEALGGAGDASPLAAAIEIVHAYSLVHDDLPCMDNDNMRRGRPTTHRAFDVPTATVVGVAMVPLAVRQVLRAADRMQLDNATTNRLVSTLMQASGAGGMVGGQLLDLQGENQRLSVADLELMHRAKTGELLAAAFTLGAIAAGASAAHVDVLTAVGHNLGLAFQIADDVLDATASSESLGKTAGHDAALAKSTYASVLGVPAARSQGNALVADAMRHMDAAGLGTPQLERLARFVATRRS